MAETVQESEAESRKRIFEELPVPQALKVMVVPTIISQIIVLIYNMADTFYVGRTNDPYMVAGVSLILPVFNIQAEILKSLDIIVNTFSLCADSKFLQSFFNPFPGNRMLFICLFQKQFHQI